MNASLLVFLFRAGDHCAPSSRVEPPQAVLHGDTAQVLHGDNGLWVHQPVRVHAVQPCGEPPRQLEDAFAYDFRYFNAAQRAASRAAQARLQDLLAPVAGTPSPPVESLVPLVIGVRTGHRLALYHHVQQGEAGALFVRYHELDLASTTDWSAWPTALEAGAPHLRAAWPLLNDDCWYTKWRSDIEMERKYTFHGIPDTWRLTNALYDEVLQHRLAGFVPELDREFQVFDYESHLFEVSGDADEAGYISYIPQTNGRMTLKRKWFVENAEIRRETVTGDLDITLDTIEAHARTLTSATLRRMPVFRRTRFDVNFESLRTGNVYGVYFDICRTTEPPHSFSQCEVEYCRTRSFSDLREVESEFEGVCAYVATFLDRHSVAFDWNTFSKLDFVRQAAALGRSVEAPREMAL